jgi:hypothetical protein
LLSTEHQQSGNLLYGDAIGSAGGWSRFTAWNALRTRRQHTLALFKFARNITTLRFRYGELGEFLSTQRGSNGTITAHPPTRHSSSQHSALSADAEASKPGESFMTANVWSQQKENRH